MPAGDVTPSPRPKSARPPEDAARARKDPARPASSTAAPKAGPAAAAKSKGLAASNKGGWAPLARKSSVRKMATRAPSELTNM